MQKKYVFFSKISIISDFSTIRTFKDNPFQNILRLFKYFEAFQSSFRPKLNRARLMSPQMRELPHKLSKDLTLWILKNEILRNSSACFSF